MEEFEVEEEFERRDCSVLLNWVFGSGCLRDTVCAGFLPGRDTMAMMGWVVLSMSRLFVPLLQCATCTCFTLHCAD